MSKNSILNQLKSIIPDMVDSNGNTRVTPIGWVGKQNLSNNRIKFLEDLITLLTTTSIITDETRMYISDKYISMRGVNEVLNSRIENENDKIDVHSTTSKIQYDKNKLQRLFGESFLRDIMDNSCDISNYEKTLAELFVKKSNTNDARKNLLLHIRDNCVCTELSDAKFDDFLNTISPYIVTQVRAIENIIDDDCCGYFNYLLSMPNLNNKDKERLRTLLERLDGDDGIEM